MSQKQGKHEESTFNKLKHFLGLSSKSGSGHSSHVRQSSVQYVFTPELVKEIGKGSPANNRLKTIKDLCDVVQTHRLEQNAVEVLWQSTQDLLQPQTQPDDRHLAYRFYSCLIKGQYDTLGMMRAHFFRIVKTYTLYEDLPYRLTLFSNLTNDGKDLQYFEEETGPFLLEWMKDIMKSNKISDFLRLLINIIKFNAAYMDEEIISGIVLNTCVIASKTGHENDIELCLNVLDTVVVYSYLPSASLYHFIVCVCRIVNIEKFSVVSWSIMRRLLGTHLGHSAIYTMCCILQDKTNITESGIILLRGATFFVGMALWGSKKVPSLKHPPSAVLPSFLQALEQSKSSIVAYEIVLSVQRLVNKYGKDQQMITWDIILSIVHALLKHVETSANVKPVLISNIHDVLTGVEELHKQSQFNGNSDRFFNIIETCAHKRPETSILVLVQHKANQIHPAKEGWVSNLYHLLDKYYRHEVRTKIRLKVLDILSYVLSANRHLHEDELIENVVFPQLCHVESDQDVEVRKRAAQLLVDLSHTCLSLHCLDLLNVLHKIINRPFCSAAPDSPVLLVDSSDKPRPLDSKMEDILVSLKGLVSVFHTKLYQQPITHAVKIYEMLVGHVEAHYHREHMIRFGGCLRKEVFSLLLELRADVQYRLGLPSKTKVGSYSYSSFALCAYGVDLCEQPQQTVELTSSSGAGSPSVRSSPNTNPLKSVIISYAQAFKCLRTCLELEKDWNVMKLLLEELPQLLQNKTLILAASHEDIDRFAARLCAMVSNKGLGLPEGFHNIPAKFSKSDFHGYVFPVLTCLVAYHTHLDKHRQTDLVKCLEFGLVSKRARICVDALAVCCLEVHDVMMRQLPSVLLRLSQISATVAMAIPLMEFLSGIIRMPQLYANFVEEQYMSVFAIALPYTNPFKYSHYTVSLAYHVIAMWFVKCKLSFRKKFVAFIVKGLRSNVLRQFEETASLRARQNQDSADRIRTNSLNDDNTKNNRSRAFSMNDAVLRKKAAAAKAKLQAAQGSSLNASLDGGIDAANMESMMFHKELMETCIDAMARYTFSTITSMPKRTPVSDFLLKEGMSQSWLLGNKIITITTSGGAKVNARGLCENCYSLARKASVHRGNVGGATEEPMASTSSSTRRRHRSAAVKSMSEMVPLETSSQDDMTLRRKSVDSTGDLVKSETALSTSSLNSNEDTNGYSVQGPRRLSQESKEEKIQIVDSVLMGLKARPTDKSIFSPQICSCWCVQWAEVHIRRPTGNMAWMMRIENEQDLTEFMDFTLSDLTSLFMANSEVESFEKVSRRKKIDSMTLGDREYESLMEQHFTPHEEQNGVEGLEEEEKEDEEFSLRKSSSTPDLTPTSPTSKLPTISSAKQVPAPLKTASAENAQKSLKETKSATEQTSTLSDTKQSDKGGSEIKVRKSSTSSSENDTLEDMVTFEFERSHSISHLTSPRRRLQRKISLPETKRPTSFSKSFIPEIPLVGSTQHGGYNPAFLFLQLYHSNIFDSGEVRPLSLPSNSPDVMRSVKMLDFLHPSETHRIGVIYIGSGQVNNECAILANMHGSTRYVKFLQGLGHLLRLKDCKPGEVFVGGLDIDNLSDGPFAYAWKDDFMQVIYHVATLMPNKSSDPNCNDKKRHIGNDFVTIVYNESGDDYKIGTIKCQFNYVNIIIQPLDNECNTVTVQTRDDIREIIGHADTKIISDAHLAVLVRQMAVNANLASTILQRQKTNPKDPYASNWLERLRQIKRVRQKVEQSAAKDSSAKTPDSPISEDFTDFV